MISFKRSRILLNIIFAFLITVNHCMCDKVADRKALKDKLLNGYDKVIRPTTEGSNTTAIRSGLVPRQVIEVDEDRGIFSLDSYFYMVWTDSRLKWNRTLDFDVKRLQLPPDLLWLPDITVHNSHSLSVDPTQDVLLYVKSTGQVVWVPPIFTQTSCGKIMESTYPYDEVECEIQMGAWAHSGWEIDYSHGNLWWMLFENIHPRWEVIVSKSHMLHKKTQYDEDHELFLSLNYYFSLKRRPLPEIEATRNPCILAMLLTLSVFWLPPDSSKKLYVLGILLLVLTMVLVYVSYNTKYSLGILVAVSVVQSTMYIVSATFLLQVLVISNLCSLKGPARPPAIVLNLLTGSLGKCVCLHWPFTNDSLQLYRIEVTKEESPASKNSPSPNDEWMLFAAGLDRLFFVLVSVAMAFCITYEWKKLQY